MVKGVGRGKGGGGPPGNKKALKLKDPDVRQRAYKKYCEWLEKGKSPFTFTFEEDNYKCTGETIKSYIKDEVEFDPIHKQFAFSKGYAYWEQVVEDSAIGVNEKANTASLQMIMRNKYGWDKQQSSQQTHKSDVQEIAQGLRAQSLSETENSNQDIE